MQIDPAEAGLQSAEGLYEQRDLEGAEKAFKQILGQTDDKAKQGRAYYGLARIAIRQNQLHQAKDLFERTTESGTDAGIAAWAHVYLGRIALAERDDKKADEQFKIALATEGISAMAREAAEKGLESTSSKGDKQR